MKDNESASERLRREAEELRETAVDLVEHAARKSQRMAKRRKTGRNERERASWRGCVEFCPSELGTREAADLPRSTAKLQNAAEDSLASECKS
jgi:hypothetical protein